MIMKMEKRKKLCTTKDKFKSEKNLVFAMQLHQCHLFRNKAEAHFHAKQVVASGTSDCCHAQISWWQSLKRKSPKDKNTFLLLQCKCFECSASALTLCVVVVVVVELEKNVQEREQNGSNWLSIDDIKKRRRKRQVVDRELVSIADNKRRRQAIGCWSN